MQEGEWKYVMLLAASAGNWHIDNPIQVPSAKESHMANPVSMEWKVTLPTVGHAVEDRGKELECISLIQGKSKEWEQ